MGKSLNTESGFSIIEVILAATIMSGLSLVFGTMIVQQRQAAIQLEDQLARLQLTRNVESMLVESMACQISLLGVVIPVSGSTDISVLKDKLGHPIVASNSVTDNLKVGQISVTNVTVPSPSASGIVEVVLPIQRARSSFGVVDLRPISTKMRVTVDGMRQVTSCAPPAEIVIKNGNFTGTTTIVAPPGFTLANCKTIASVESFGWGGQDENAGFVIDYPVANQIRCRHRDIYTMYDATCNYIMICQN